MWLSSRLLMAIVVVMLLAASYAELVLDVRAPRSPLFENHAVSADASALITNFDAVAAAMKTTYGPNAVTTIQSPPLRWVVKVDDKIVHEEPVPATFSGALGFFVIGARGKVASMFPFRLDPQVVPPPHRYSPAQLRERFKDVKDARVTRLLVFNDAAAAEGPCTVVEPSDFGSVGSLLQLRTGTFCVIDWSGVKRGSALVGAVLADGDPWMRPFTERICRSLTTLALHKIAAVRRQPPDYAACLMIDRPKRAGAAKNLRVHVYEAGGAETLALIAPPQSNSAVTEALAALE